MPGESAAGGEAAAEGGGVISKFVLGPLIAVIAGLLIGGLIGNACDNYRGSSALKYNVGRSDPACTNVGGIKPSLPISGWALGCETSLAQTIQATEASCAANHKCAGSCPASGGSCVPVSVIETVHQTPHFFSCDTLIAFHCDCGCK